MTKRVLIAILACIMVFITLGSSAEASGWSSATKAVEHRIADDNDMRDTVGGVSALCDHRPSRCHRQCHGIRDAGRVRSRRCDGRARQDAHLLMDRLPERPEAQPQHAPLVKAYGSLLLMILAADEAKRQREDK
jgi:hypothetical protein